MHRTLVFLFTLMLSAWAQDPTPDFGWQAVSRMSDARYDHCAVALGDGRVMVAGGMGANGPLNTVEIFGPDNSFRAAAPMSMARAQHSCTLLPDGRILVAGGSNEATSELFDPIAGIWSPLSGATIARHGQTATLISRGRVVLAGGFSGDQPVSALEIYDSLAEQITNLPVTLAIARARHTAVLLSDGRVLFIGGTDGVNSLASSEIFDPEAGTVTSSGPLVYARAGHITTTLLDGRVLVAAGASGGIEMPSAEVYSESTSSFSRLDAALTIPRQDAFATLIPGSGLVLIGGGTLGGQALPDTELFDPASNQFVVAGALTAPRTSIHGATLANGVILATGGQNANGPSDACGVFAVPRLTFTKSQYNAGETAVVNGSGFNASAGKSFFLSLTATQSGGSVLGIDFTRILTRTVVPDATGQFTASILVLTANDFGATFSLKASLASVPDGTSNTIVFSEQPTASFSGPNLADTVLTFDPIPASSVAGASIPFGVTLDSTRNTPFTGLVHIRIGAIVKVFNVTNLAPGTKSSFSFCCADPGPNQFVNVNYGVDPLHLSVTVNGPTHTVVARQVQISLQPPTVLSLPPTLPLFQDGRVPIVIAVPAALGPPLGGSVTLTRQVSGATPQTAVLPVATAIIPGAPVGFGLQKAVSFPFRATFADKPTACFTAAYSGDGFYPPASDTVCINSSPAIPKLELTGANNYTFDTGYPAQVKLTFPNELGVVNRTVHLDPLGVDLTLNVAVGSATASTTLTLPFSITGINATYAGGTDLSAASASLAFSMNPVPTLTILAPIPSPTSNPITLAANVVPSVGRSTGPPVAPSGIVQFFDGPLFLGQATLVEQTNGSGRATLSGLARPVGARAIKAMYLGTTQFATSASPVQTVTIQ